MEYFNDGKKLEFKSSDDNGEFAMTAIIPNKDSMFISEGQRQIQMSSGDGEDSCFINVNKAELELIKRLVDDTLATYVEDARYRYYVDNVDMMDNQWLKEIFLETRLPSKSFSIYSEDEFLEKLETDENFNKKWGSFKLKTKK